MSASERFDLRLEAQDDGGYDSTNEDDHYAKSSKRARYDLATKEKKDLRKHAKGDKEVLRTEASMEEGRKQRIHLNSMTAYDRHKQLINTYQLYHRGATGKLQRDTTRDRRDIDIIRQHHKFLWDDSSGGEGTEETWEQQLARRYYDKLFKEYCIIDLSRYKENKFGMRWRIEKEVVIGKGQFVCANKKCDDVNKLRTWEVNFGYVEDGVKKNALVKCRLCSECSYKLNYTHKKKELTKGKKKKKKKEKKRKKDKDSSSSSEESETGPSSSKPNTAKSDDKTDDDFWSAPIQKEEETNREDEFNNFLEDLFM